MSQRLDQIVARVEDPATPVVWLDPSTDPALWAALPAALSERGFATASLDGIAGQESLRLELRRALHGDGSPRELLLSLPWAERQQGWAILFRCPEQLREADEAAFEELLETVSQVHEMHWNTSRRHLKLIVTD